MYSQNNVVCKLVIGNRTDDLKGSTSIASSSFSSFCSLPRLASTSRAKNGEGYIINSVCESTGVVDNKLGESSRTSYHYYARYYMYVVAVIAGDIALPNETWNWNLFWGSIDLRFRNLTSIHSGLHKDRGFEEMTGRASFFASTARSRRGSIGRPDTVQYE